MLVKNTRIRPSTKGALRLRKPAQSVVSMKRPNPHPASRIMGQVM